MTELWTPPFDLQAWLLEKTLHFFFFCVLPSSLRKRPGYSGKGISVTFLGGGGLRVSDRPLSVSESRTRALRSRNWGFNSRRRLGEQEDLNHFLLFLCASFYRPGATYESAQTMFLKHRTPHSVRAIKGLMAVWLSLQSSSPTVHCSP